VKTLTQIKNALTDVIHINSFVKRQTQASSFSHYLYSWEKLQDEIVTQIAKAINPNTTSGVALPILTGDVTFGDTVTQGFREGVILVTLDPNNVQSGVIQLTDGTDLVGRYESRRTGETPRIRVMAKNKTKQKAALAYAVLYNSKVLSEDKDNELDASVDNWEVISINASPVNIEMPIEPNTLMHNHFGSDGGTDTQMSDSDFVKQLRESHGWWKDKSFSDDNITTN
jgi:hypothetical protein